MVANSHLASGLDAAQPEFAAARLQVISPEGIYNFLEVLMMSIPGLALFYCGMVRKKNILATMAQTLICTMLCSTAAGYSLAFSGDGALIALRLEVTVCYSFPLHFLYWRLLSLEAQHPN